MRYLWLLLALPLMGFTPIFSKHDSTDKIDREIRNAEASLQDQSFTVFNSTPNLRALKDGQIVIVTSNTWNVLMWRNNEEIYKVTGSCVTVTR